MQGITERDIAYDMLFGTKSMAHMYNQASLEAAHQNIFHMFRELEHHSVESQHRIWDYLHRRQEYRVSEAHPREIEEVRQRMEHLAQNHLEGARVGGGRGEYARYGTATPSGYGTAWSGTSGNYASPGSYTGTGYGSTGYGQPGTETRTDWGRNESGRGLPDWTRESVRR